MRSRRVHLHGRALRQLGGCRGQAIMEYAIVIGLVIAALLGMQVYAKRSIQASIKTAADGLSPFAGDTDGKKAQIAGASYEAGERRNRAITEAGTVLERRAAVTTDVQRKLAISEKAGGVRSTTIQSDTTSNTGALAGGASSYSKVVVESK